MSVHKHGTTGPGCAGTCCLKATDLGVSFGGEEVLRDVSFHLHCGEIVALIGPNVVLQIALHLLLFVG